MPTRKPKVPLPEASRPDENPEVAAIAREIKAFFDQDASAIAPGKNLGNLYGIYAFFDFRNRPLYVGLSEEGLRARIGRHLTNQRTDAVAMGVLDPAEVVTVKVWPFADKSLLPAAEYNVMKEVTKNDQFVLNEKKIPEAAPIDLPEPWEKVIVPPEILALRSRLDARIARCSQTLFRLAQVINDRQLRQSSGLRHVLYLQTIRLQELVADSTGAKFEPIPVESQTEDTGESD